MGYGPTRCGGSKPKPGLQRQIIHLVDHAIYVIAKIRPGHFNCAVMADQLFRRVTGFKQGVGGKPQGAQARHRLRLAWR